MRKSQRKGKRIQVEAAKYLTRLGFPAESARNHDITCPSLPRLHIEVKGDEKIDLGTKALDDAIFQAATDAIGNGQNRYYAILWKRKYTCWRITFSLDGFKGVTLAGDGAIAAVLHRFGNKE